jgi:hypothetical protein
VNPSAFAFVSWNEKSFVNACTFTGVVKNAERASSAPPSVNRNRLALVITGPPFKLSPLEDVKLA